MSQSVVLKIPNSIYNTNPEKAIMSILGNDIKINSYNSSSFITNNDELYVNVDYSYVDVNPFSIYLIEDLKHCNTVSNYLVCKIQNNFVLITSKPKKLPCYIKIDTIKTKKFQLSADTDIFISYRGIILRNKHDIFNNFTNLIEVPKLSLHGSNLYKSIKKPDVPFNQQFKNLIKLYPFNMNSEKDIFKSSDMFNIPGIDKHISINNFKHVDIKNIPDSVIINCEELSPIDIFQQYVDKTGIIFISNKRNSPFVFYYIPNEFYKITKTFLKQMLYVLCKDAENLELFENNKK